MLSLAPRPQSWRETEPRPGSLQDLSLGQSHTPLTYCQTPVLGAGWHVDHTAHSRQVLWAKGECQTSLLKGKKTLPYN